MVESGFSKQVIMDLFIIVKHVVVWLHFIQMRFFASPLMKL